MPWLQKVDQTRSEISHVQVQQPRKPLQLASVGAGAPSKPLPQDTTSSFTGRVKTNFVKAGTLKPDPGAWEMEFNGGSIKRVEHFTCLDQLLHMVAALLHVFVLFV